MLLIRTPLAMTLLERTRTIQQSWGEDADLNWAIFAALLSLTPAHLLRLVSVIASVPILAPGNRQMIDNERNNDSP